VTFARSPHVGRVGVVSHVFWREEKPWVRIRSREGTCLSVPWKWTDLPKLVVSAPVHRALLSPRALMDLVHHLERTGALSHGQSTKRLSR
jgi:hypothetical protein